MRKGVTASAACLAALTMGAAMAPTASADANAAPDRITIEVQTVNGSGCPRGTTAVAPSPDRTAFTVTYSDYMAQAGGDSNPTDMRKNCQLNLKIHIPQGFTYAIASADYRGYAYLGKGASAVERANYYFQGMSSTTPVTHNLRGAYDGNWQFTDRTPVAELVWKPCGEDRNLNINTELRVYEGNDKDETNFISFDSADGDVKTIYRFQWKKC
ncbi:uncharacterized protein DUF4360 [Actinomadura pelletieri DSM 43383]|uniref:Uncharacterized protein DUF4360 n=1 Tax=Actinomadura pelletieri DSM 43383 TaxID=1120940 RepID=A0A495QJI2_9ACTN|nr:DUF4360 domain-containing protein [Actinomadura pelletieri]RKS72196.1 uncharacterized protein DUF4360 [Actinomadura pelletieri DSM 43383]